MSSLTKLSPRPKPSPYHIKKRTLWRITNNNSVMEFKSKDWYPGLWILFRDISGMWNGLQCILSFWVVCTQDLVWLIPRWCTAKNVSNQCSQSAPCSRRWGWRIPDGVVTCIFSERPTQRARRRAKSYKSSFKAESVEFWCSSMTCALIQ